MSEWQPIETAPKTPDWILIGYFPKWADGHCIGGKPLIGYYDCFDGWFRDERGRELLNDKTSFSPTHWMPLPEPPK